MFQWTDGEVSHVVKLALESLRSANHNLAASHRSRLIEALASELSASAWHAHTIEAQAIEAAPSQAEAFQLPAVASGVVEHGRQPSWTILPSAAERDGSEFCPSQRYAPQLLRLLARARASGAAAEETIHRSVELTQADEQSAEQSQHALVWLAVQPEGTCACIEFLKRPGDGPFTMRDEAVLRILSPELLTGPAVDSASADAACPEVSGRASHAGEPAETVKLAELPRRQREVLARLLIGASVKQIASELGISPYTVNDYIKALYRRYHVSSRGELMAAVHGLRRPAVPK